MRLPDTIALVAQHLVDRVARPPPLVRGEPSRRVVDADVRAPAHEARAERDALLLQEAGAHVMYGVVGYKTHAKIIMVVRRERGKLRRYCHFGTGNYHPNTARVYTDYGLFTCDEAMGEDLHELFLQLTSLTQVQRLRKLLQSPFALHSTLVEKVGRETTHARAGRPLVERHCGLAAVLRRPVPDPLDLGIGLVDRRRPRPRCCARRTWSRGSGRP